MSQKCQCLFWIQGLTPGSSGFVPLWDVSPWCLPPVVGIGMGWGREQGSPECVQKYWSQWELGLLEGWLVGVEIGVVFLVPLCLYLHCRWDNGPISELPTETKLTARAC